MLYLDTNARNFGVPHLNASMRIRDVLIAGTDEDTFVSRVDPCLPYLLIIVAFMCLIATLSMTKVCKRIMTRNNVGGGDEDGDGE